MCDTFCIITNTNTITFHDLWPFLHTVMHIAYSSSLATKTTPRIRQPVSFVNSFWMSCYFHTRIPLKHTEVDTGVRGVKRLERMVVCGWFGSWLNLSQNSTFIKNLVNRSTQKAFGLVLHEFEGSLLLTAFLDFTEKAYFKKEGFSQVLILYVFCNF